MNRAFKVVVLLGLIIATTVGGLALAEPRTPACLRSWPEVRYRAYGYDHIVHIVNECRAHAFCAVSSDVNPTSVEVEVPAFGQLEVITCRGCASREFTPRLTCRFVSQASTPSPSARAQLR